VLAFHRADSFELILSNLQASYNKISDLQDLDDELAVLPKLETVYLEGNPCQLKNRLQAEGHSGAAQDTTG
jgi:hypothetical protein